MSDRTPELRLYLDKLVGEAINLRMSALSVRPDASTGEMLEALMDVRRRLDRVEELLATALQLRGVAARRQTACRIEADDAWDEVAVRARQAALRDEYSSAKERAAAVNLEILDLRRALRLAEIDLSWCDEAVESIRLRFRGLADHRQDILAMVKIRQFESSLDR